MAHGDQVYAFVDGARGKFKFSFHADENCFAGYVSPEETEPGTRGGEVTHGRYLRDGEIRSDPTSRPITATVLAGMGPPVLMVAAGLAMTVEVAAPRSPRLTRPIVVALLLMGIAGLVL